MAFQLDHEIIDPPDDVPGETALFVHGIMGSARNWRSFAQRFVAAMPRFRAVLVDLRHHGRSRGAPPPDDLEACAKDLDRLVERLGPIQVVIAHSFGGKVAIRWMEHRPPELHQVFILDCPLSAVPVEAAANTEVARVLAAIAAIPEPISRRSLVQEKLLALGHPPALAGWMATNLARAADGFHWTFDRLGIGRLIEDYWSRDLRAAAAHPPEGVRVDLVRALESDRWTSAELAFLASLPEGGATRVHEMADVGHWLHTDDPEGLLRLLSRCLG